MTERSWSFLIVAGGSGSRLGGEPKQFRLLGGLPVWRWSARIAEGLWRAGKVKELVVAMPHDCCEKVRRHAESALPTFFAEGGSTRAESVMNGLKACSGSHVLVHDAARPFITEDLCLKLMEEAVSGGSAVPLLPSADSLKKVDGEAVECADRRKYFRTQTPQAFEREPLIQAIESFGLDGTDEAAAWLGSGRKIGTVCGEEANFKITTQFDWAVAAALADSRVERRVGHGYDVHKLVPGRRLVLAGIEIKDSPVGLLGHSDADLVTHAVMDAILGASGEPDIGTLFPASDGQWKDAHSTELLQSVLSLVRGKGWRIEWVDVTLEAQVPRLGHLIGKFADNLGRFLMEDDGGQNFNIKVKSGEGCGSVGRAECMVCHGVASLSRIKNI
jgi:2-C-methyl-D-erythritol 4-phosphate cytidylyltransferase/2-C-methyl-D-erythritol 2,4-cyclodiphosphate synthase